MSSSRRNPIVLLGIAVAVALVVVVALVVASSGGDDEERSGTPTPAPAKATRGVLDGIAQDGAVLGDPQAPVTLREFADLQCPFCRDFAVKTFPSIVRDFVRTGKVRMVYHDLAFLGADSETAARAAYAAGEQDRLWDFVERFLAAQGEENSGYVTDAFVERIFRSIEGLDVAKAKASVGGGAGREELAEAKRLAGRYAIDGTPAFAAGPTDSQQELLGIDSLGYETAARSAGSPGLEWPPPPGRPSPAPRGAGPRAGGPRRRGLPHLRALRRARAAVRAGWRLRARPDLRLRRGRRRARGAPGARRRHVPAGRARGHAPATIGPCPRPTASRPVTP
jgi:protein-disulfide isomerase